MPHYAKHLIMYTVRSLYFFVRIRLPIDWGWMPNRTHRVSDLSVSDYFINEETVSRSNRCISTLYLLVLRILADYPDASFSLDDFALFAHRFYWTSNLHLKALLSKKTIFEYTTSVSLWQELFYIFGQMSSFWPVISDLCDVWWIIYLSRWCVPL